MDIRYVKIRKELVDAFAPLLSGNEKQLLLAEEHIYAYGAVDQEKEQEPQACGILVYEETEYELQVITLVVAEEYRRKGIGTGLLERLCEQAQEEASSVTSVFSASGEEDVRYQFFDQNDRFLVTGEEGAVYCLDQQMVLSHRLIQVADTVGVRCRSLFEVESMKRSRLIQQLTDAGIFYLDTADSEDLVRPLCLCVEEDSQITALMFVARRGADYEITYFWGQSGRQKDMMGMLAHFAKLWDGDNRLWVNAVTKSSQDFVEKLFPQNEPKLHFYRADLLY